MNLRQSSLLSIAVLWLFGNTVRVQASSELIHASSALNRTIVLRISDLRSAYLIRSGQVQYDANDMTPRGLRRQLQCHFDTVAALLLLATPQSIELALDRLEASQQESWSAAERAGWRRRLLINRQIQLVRLVDYRNRGLFPQNEGHAAQPVPIFVDAHDTACAVGHLMRLSGRELDVAAIRHENNFVYVPDVAAGPVVAWSLTSGLTLEEAALIQPAYGPILHPIPDDAFEILDDEASFVFGDLRYSNLKMFPSTGNASPPTINIPVTHQFCAFFQCTIIGPNDPVVFPVLDTTYYVDPIPERMFPQVEAGDYSRVVIQFDVEVTAPNLRIVNKPLANTLFWNQAHPSNQLQLFVSGAQDRMWIDRPSGISLEQSQLELVGIVPISPAEGERFEPTTQMTVVTEMLLRPNQYHQAQGIYFEVLAVPEPASVLLTVLSIALTAMVWPIRGPR